MQFTTVASLGLFAALASASQHVPQHFHQRRQYNASVPSTTLTVFATSVYTITSCAATVTDCPADQATSEQVITSTVASYTTVCPVAEASSASSAVLSSYSALASSTAKGPVSTPKGTAGYPTKPYPTGETETTPSAPIGTGFTTKGEVVYPTASGSESVVLTYTLGSGTSTTVVTTTIKHTQTATVYATKPGSEESASLTKGVPTSTDELTTTITGTSTSTRYITVVPAPSGGPSAAGSAECVPVTVTVTQATATVTVTAPGYPAQTTGANSGEVSSAPGAASYPTEKAPNSELVSVSTATVVPVPYSTGAPYGNATISTKTKSKKPCSSVYPSGYSTGVPSGAAVPTGTYPIVSSKPAGVASPTGAYPGYPVESAPASSSSTAEGPATTPVVEYPVKSEEATTSTAEGPATSAPAGYPVNAYPTY